MYGESKQIAWKCLLLWVSLNINLQSDSVYFYLHVYKTKLTMWPLNIGGGVGVGITPLFLMGSHTGRLMIHLVKGACETPTIIWSFAKGHRCHSCLWVSSYLLDLFGEHIRTHTICTKTWKLKNTQCSLFFMQHTELGFGFPLIINMFATNCCWLKVRYTCTLM